MFLLCCCLNGGCLKHMLLFMDRILTNLSAVKKVKVKIHCLQWYVFFDATSWLQTERTPAWRLKMRQNRVEPHRRTSRDKSRTSFVREATSAAWTTYIVIKIFLMILIETIYTARRRQSDGMKCVETEWNDPLKSVSEAEEDDFESSLFQVFMGVTSSDT